VAVRGRNESVLASALGRRMRGTQVLRGKRNLVLPRDAVIGIQRPTNQQFWVFPDLLFAARSYRRHLFR